MSREFWHDLDAIRTLIRYRVPIQPGKVIHAPMESANYEILDAINFLSQEYGYSIEWKENGSDCEEGS